MLDDGSVLGDACQKIFPIEEPGSGRVLAYAIAGTIGFVRDRRVSLFDLHREIEIARRSVQAAKFEKLEEYLRALLDEVILSLFWARKTKQIPRYPDAEQRAEVFAQGIFVGYYNGEAQCCTVSLRPLLSPLLLVQSLTPNSIHLLSGSKVIANEMFAGSGRGQAMHSMPSGRRLSVIAGAALARKYIRACIENPVQEGRSTIAGHVHIAVVERRAFRWLDPPVRPR